MSATTTVKKWYNLVPPDNTGAFVKVIYDCPICGDKDMDQTHLIGARNLHLLDTGFEICDYCGSCGEPLVIDCPIEAKE